ncbi:MAG: hypothetical protein ACRD1T_25900, partial [Acidimicrobiia bacterium]
MTQRFLLFLIPIAALTAPALAQQQEQDALRTKLSGEFTPRVSGELAKGPVPRLPDGKPDMSGPWVGGGSNDDMEREG